MKRTRMRRQSKVRRALQQERRWLLDSLALAIDRCEFCRRVGPLDGHETRKPRTRYWLNRNYVVMLCRACHERCEWPYAKGRLMIPGTRDTGWGFYLQFAPDKFAARALSERSEAP